MNMYIQNKQLCIYNIKNFPYDQCELLVLAAFYDILHVYTRQEKTYFSVSESSVCAI